MMTLADYENLYKNSSIRADHEKELSLAGKKILANSQQYANVARRTSIPWQCVAAIHFRESGLNFDRHLHNGDPLTARTTHVPANRPVDGEPPFTWADSAVDALSGTMNPSKSVRNNGWTLGAVLMFLERYNGFAYQKHQINSPYLWSYTTAYEKGLYVSDGSFNPESVSEQAGCVAILKSIEPLDFAIPELLA